jgi:hypothetical protein
MSVQDGTQTGSLDLSRSRHSESIDTQAMMAEETCAIHELSSTKIMADFSELPLNLGLEEPVSKDDGATSALSRRAAGFFRDFFECRFIGFGEGGGDLAFRV